MALTLAEAEGHVCPEHQEKTEWESSDGAACAAAGGVWRARAGVVKLPWAEASSRFTALFEALAIEWLREASRHAVGRQMDLSWENWRGESREAVLRAAGLTGGPARVFVGQTAYSLLTGCRSILG